MFNTAFNKIYSNLDELLLLTEISYMHFALYIT